MHQCVDMNLLSLTANSDMKRRGFKAPFVSNWINFHSKRSHTCVDGSVLPKRQVKFLFDLPNVFSTFVSCLLGTFPISKASFEILFMTVNPLPRMSKRWKLSSARLSTPEQRIFFSADLLGHLWIFCVSLSLKVPFLKLAKSLVCLKQWIISGFTLSTFLRDNSPI